MNAKQRRQFVRQYKHKIELDRVVVRLEGKPPYWFDAADPHNLHRYRYDGEPVVETVARLNFYYARVIQSKEQTSC